MEADKIEQLLQLGKDIKVLFVEDNEESRISTTIMLKNFFVHIHVAMDGLDGWEKFQKNNYDLVISDINMPKLNGIEMIKKIRQKNSDVATLILSAYGELEYFLDTIRLGIDGYLLKPIETNQFLEILHKTLQKIHLKKENETYKSSLEQKVKEKTGQLEYLYNHDALTGLKNRNSLIKYGKENNIKGIMIIDIDRFSAINDIYGTIIGDKILIGVAKLLIEVSDSDYLVYRLSNDHFAVLNTKKLSSKQYVEKAHSLIETVKSDAIKINFQGLEIVIVLSITIAIVNGQDTLKLLQLADMTLRHAKKSHQPLAVYSEKLGLEKRYSNELSAVHMVKQALSTNRLVPFFQPIAKTDGIAYECLARIVDGDKIIYPFDFIGGIKKTAYYYELTRTILQKSIETFKNRTETFSINLSFEDISNEHIVKDIKKQIETSGIAERIIFEILETEAIEDFELVRAFIKEMRELKVRIAIDDFGSGYSNFTNIIEFKPDYIKIDGSLIKNIDKDADAHILSKAIVNVAHKMGIKVIAEFVHNESVYEKLKQLNIDGYQGYFLGKPTAEIPIVSTGSSLAKALVHLKTISH